MTFYRRLNHRVPTEKLIVVGTLYRYDSICYNEVRKETLKFLRTEFPEISTAKIVALSQHDARGHLWGILLLQFPGQQDWNLVAEFGHWLSCPESHIPIRMEHFRFIWDGELDETVSNTEEDPEIGKQHWTLEGIERHDHWVRSFDPFKEMLRTVAYINAQARSARAAHGQ